MIFTQVWLLAMINGGTITVSVDMFGEMWPEYVLWFLIWPIMTLGLYYIVEDHLAQDADQNKKSAESNTID